MLLLQLSSVWKLAFKKTGLFYYAFHQSSRENAYLFMHSFYKFTPVSQIHH